jgi:hypothetical protein
MAELSFGARGLRGLMAAGLFFSAVSEALPESVTLSTYYPAPSGAYTQILATGNSYLARDWGDVGIGTTNMMNKLDLNGGLAVGSYAGTVAAPANGAIISGKVGLGTSSPLSQLDVASGGLAVGTYAGTNQAPANGAIISGNVGIGTSSPGQALEVSGGVKVDGAAVYPPSANTITKESIVKAWCNFAGPTGTISGGCFNVASVARTAVGQYTITWATPFASASYAISGTCSGGASITNFALNVGAPLTTASANVVCVTWNGSYTDSSVVTFIAVGLQ